MSDEEKRHEALVYGWAFALAVGFRPLRHAAGIELLKLGAIYLFIGLLAWAFCVAIIEVGKRTTDKPRVLVEAGFLLGITAAVLLLGK